MTGDESRLLGVGDRVCWGMTTTDLGTVIGTAWCGVTIAWDDGQTTSIQHNDGSGGASTSAVKWILLASRQGVITDKLRPAFGD